MAFTFTASEIMNSGEVSLAVPAGWSVPQGNPAVAGYTTAASALGTIGTVLGNADSSTGWAAGTACLGGLAIDTAVKQEGTGSIRCTNGNQNDGNLWYKNISAQDWSAYTKVAFWIRSSSAIGNTGELRFAYDNNPNLASPIEQIVLSQTLAANTWTYMVMDLGTTTRTSVASFGLVIRHNGNIDNDVVWVDDFLIGPGVPTFPGGGVISTRLLQLAGGQTVTLAYGSGGGASGAAAPLSGETSVFNAATRISDSGALTPISSSPLVTVFNPVPTITDIVPTGTTAVGSSSTLTVNGTNFVPTSVVRFNGSDRVTTYVSPTQLTAIILSSDISEIRPNSVTVFNQTPGGGISNAQTFTVTADIMAPSAVTNLALSSPETSSIVLTWTAPGDDGVVGSASLYDIRYATDPIVTAGDFTAAALVSGEPAPSVAGTIQNMTVTGLSANTAYYFAMKTQDEVPNISPVSNVPSLATSVTPDTVPPFAVTTLALSNPTTSSMVLTWTAPGDDGDVGTASWYDIRYSTDPIVTAADYASAAEVLGEPVPSVAGTVQNMTVAGLSVNTTYYFAMKTQDEVPNISPVSNVLSLATSADPDVTAPAAVTNLAISSPTTSSLVLIWTAPGDDGTVGTARIYDIRYATAPIATAHDFSVASLVSGEPVPSVAGTLQSMTVTGLSANTVYYFAMTTQDEGPNISTISNLPSLATSANLDVTPPASVANLAASNPTTTSIVLTWTAPGDDGTVGTANMYDIRYATAPFVTDADFSAAALIMSEPIPTAGGTTQTWTVTGLSANTMYYFAMKSQDEVPNASGVSNMASLATVSSSGGGGAAVADMTAPVSYNISVASIAQGSAIVTWETLEIADSLVRYGTGATLDGAVSEGVMTTRHSLPLVDLLPGTTYRYETCSRDATGNQSCSAAFSFMTLPVDAPEPTYGAVEALVASSTINVDKDIVTPPFGTPVPCVSGALIKLPDDGNTATQSDSSVYYCGADGKRYVFPDIGTYRSWYPDFSSVTIVSVSALSNVPLGGNVTYRPGKFLIKIQTDPKTYAVAKGGVLRWVTSEDVALSLYGLLWNDLVNDISDAFFGDYRIGEPIHASDVAPPVIVTEVLPPPPSGCRASTTFTAYLALGSNDPQVRTLQALLGCLGHLAPDVPQTGHFGPATEAAVKSFQTANGIEPLGYLGPATRAALNRYVAP